MREGERKIRQLDKEIAFNFLKIYITKSPIHLKNPKKIKTMKYRKRKERI
jgi:hypothetical protein